MVTQFFTLISYILLASFTLSSISSSPPLCFISTFCSSLLHLSFSSSPLAPSSSLLSFPSPPPSSSSFPFQSSLPLLPIPPLCVCVCLCASLHTCVSVCVSDLCMYVLVYICLCMRVCVCVCLRAFVCVCACFSFGYVTTQVLSHVSCNNTFGYLPCLKKMLVYLNQINIYYVSDSPLAIYHASNVRVLCLSCILHTCQPHPHTHTHTHTLSPSLCASMRLRCDALIMCYVTLAYGLYTLHTAPMLPLFNFSSTRGPARHTQACERQSEALLRLTTHTTEFLLLRQSVC